MSDNRVLVDALVKFQRWCDAGGPDLYDHLTARESELAEAQQRLNEVANAQRNACTTECIDGIWWAKGSGIVAGPQATEQDVLLEVAENWWRVAAATQRRVAELEGKLGQSANYVADDELYPHVVWFANGRTVSIASGGHLEVGMGGRLAAAKGDASDEP